MANKKYPDFLSGTVAGTQLILQGDPTSGDLTKVTITELLAFIITSLPASVLVVPEHADNAAALVAGLVVGNIYRTGDDLKIVH
jgi:hypothetical protein